MLFKDIEGNIAIKNNLIRMVDDNKVSHALLFNGPVGNAKLQLAIAFAQYLNCENKHDGDSCGECKVCNWYEKMMYPDMHFLFPTANSKSKKVKDPSSADFIEEWRELITERKALFNLNDWFSKINIDSGQANINSKDCNSIIQTLSYTSFEGKFKIMLIWLPEKIYYAAAPKILKILEEPPKNTVFLLISENKQQILDTILSRCQEVYVPGFSNEEIKNILINDFSSDIERASDISEMADGDSAFAINCFLDPESHEESFDKFIYWMRVCYAAKMNEIIPFVDEMASKGREQNIIFLKNALSFLHQSLYYNETNKFIVPLKESRRPVFTKFANFITRNNIGAFYDKIQNSIFGIERNGYLPSIFMNLTIDLCRVIRKY